MFSINTIDTPRSILSFKVLFDGGRVATFLRTVKTFLDSNPNEVVTLILTNPEGLSLRNVWRPAFEESGGSWSALYTCRLLTLH